MDTYPVILLAGGQGTRAGGTLKQFEHIEGKPLIQYSLETFSVLPECRPIVILVPGSKIHYTRRLVRQHFGDIENIFVISGGRNRRESAMNGLEYLRHLTLPFQFQHIIFHDAARPMVTTSLVRSVEKMAKKYGAATVGIPAIDLLFKVKKGEITQAVNKQDYYYGFTPQCLPFKETFESHKKALDRGIYNDVDNIELLGLLKPKINIRIIDMYPNIKFTYRQDKKILGYFLRHGH